MAEENRQQYDARRLHQRLRIQAVTLEAEASRAWARALRADPDRSESHEHDAVEFDRMATESMELANAMRNDYVEAFGASPFEQWFRRLMLRTAK